MFIDVGGDGGGVPGVNFAHNLFLIGNTYYTQTSDSEPQGAHQWIGGQGNPGHEVTPTQAENNIEDTVVQSMPDASPIALPAHARGTAPSASSAKYTPRSA